MPRPPPALSIQRSRSSPWAEANFPEPGARQLASQDAAILLRDALLLSLRRGAGPFRGFGQIARATSCS